MPNNKYNQLKRQYSIDGGLTWHDLLPMVYKVGNVIETNSNCTDSDGCRWVVLPITEAYDCDSNYNMYQIEAEECLNEFGIFVRSGNIRRYRLIEDYSIACGYSGPICTPTSITSYSYDIVYNGGDVEWNEVATPVVYKITTISDIDKGCNETSSSNREEITDYTITYSPSGNNTTGEDRLVTAIVKYKGENIGSFDYTQKTKVINADLEFTFSSDSVNYMLNGEYYTANTSPYSNTLSNLGIDYLTNCYGTFMESSITELIKFPDVDQVDVMDSMFESCTELTSLDLSNWKTDSLISMNNMFFNCTALTSLNISSFNTSNVTEMGGLFSDCHSLTSIDVSNFDTSNNTIFDAMFSYCESLTSLDLSNFNTSNATSFGGMFEGCKSLKSLDLSMFDTSNVESYGLMFEGCTSLQSLDLSNWKYKKDEMFDSVTYNMFKNCSSLISIVLNNVDCDTYNFIKDEVEAAGLTSKVIITTTAENCGDDYTTTETECGEELEFVYSGSRLLYTLNFENFEANEKNSVRNDDGTYTYSTTLSELGIDRLYNCESAFTKKNYSGEIIGIKKFPCTKYVYDMSYMFHECGKLRYIDGIRNWDTSSLYNMAEMFYGCGGFDSDYVLDLSKWDYSKLETGFFNYGTHELFYGCSAIINLSNWDILNHFDEDSCYGYSNTIIANNISKGSLGLLQLDRHKGKYDIITNIEDLPPQNGTFSLISTKPQVFAFKQYLDYTTDNGDGTYTYTYTLSQLGVKNLPYAFGIFMPYYIVGQEIKLLSLPIDENTYGCKDIFFGCEGLEENLDISIFNNAPNIEFFNGCLMNKIITNEHLLNNFNLKNMSCLFRDVSNESLDVSNLDTSNVTDMAYMFDNCNNLTSLDVSNFDTSNVTTMYGMFKDSDKLTSLDVSNFDTSNVLDMAEMFQNCYNLTSLDVSGWNTSKVTTMGAMFQNCYALTSLDVSNFDTSNVTTMSSMFNNCNALTSIDCSGWDTSNLHFTAGMFANCDKLESVNVSGWDISNLIKYIRREGLSTSERNVRIYNMFGYDTNLKIIIGEVTNEEYNLWVELLNVLELPASMLVRTLNKEDNLSFEFEGSTLTYKLNGKTLTASGSPYSTYVFYETLDNGEYLFSCNKAFAHTNLTKINLFPDTSKVYNMSGMFWDCSGLTSVDVSGWNTSNVIDMTYMFKNCSNLTSLDVSGWNTSKVTTMGAMFENCSNLTSLDVSNFDTSNVTDMSNMFYKCSGLTSLDVSNFDTSKVTSMYYMFASCTNLTSLDVSNFDTSNVTTMYGMFNQCTNITSLDCSGWDTSKVTTMLWMFSCGLTSLDVSGWDLSNLDSYDSMFSNCDTITTIYCYGCNETTISKLNKVKPKNCTLVY